MLKIKSPAFWISLLGVVAVVCAAVCLVTSPAEEAAAPPVATEATVAVTTVTVKTPDELIAAIASNTEIVLEPGTYILSEAANYGEPVSEFLSWTERYDGYELTLTGVENLTIRGGGLHVTTIETDPRYANVLGMKHCRNVVLEDFTAGHTRYRGECGGGVMDLQGCQEITMNRLGLFGCGVVGLMADSCAGVTLTDSDIYECSSSAAGLYNCRDVVVFGCRIYSIGDSEYGGYTYFDIQDSTGVFIENNTLSDSTLNSLMAVAMSDVLLKNNLFSGNRPQSAVFSGSGRCITVEGNRFEENSIRNWYSYDAIARDPEGKLLSEEDLHELYGTAEEPAVALQPQLEIHVSTVDEFIAAIGPDKDIVLEAELYDLSTATGYGTSSGDYYGWEDIFDGPGLVIRNVSNMTIRTATGDKAKHTISAVPRYADVLQFKACNNITLSGFTAGHTREPGSCTGGVLDFNDCDVITVDRCGLFGCGILGVQADYGSNLTVKDTEIYECSIGGINVWEVDGITVEGVSFRDIGGSNTICLSQCRNATVDGLQVIGSQPGSYQASSPEQEEAMALNSVLNGFAVAYLSGDAEYMEIYLASGYEPEPWTGSGEALPLWFEATYSHVEQLRKSGSLAFEVPFREDWNDTDEPPMILVTTVIEEDGVFKVSGCSVK